MAQSKKQLSRNKANKAKAEEKKKAMNSDDPVEKYKAMKELKKKGKK